MNTKDLDSHSGSRFLEPQDPCWLEFLNAAPEATIFHHPSWLNVLAESYGYHPSIIAACDAAGHVRAGLPVMEIRSLARGRHWVSLPFTDYCAPLYDNLESLGKLVNGLVVLHQTGRLPKLEVRWDLPAYPPIQARPAFYRHTVKLAADPQVVMKRFERTHRQNIGTAECRGVTIERGTEPEHTRRFYQLQVETRRRKGLPVQPWKFFDLLGKQVLAQGLGFILLAYKDSECMAGGLFLHWQQTLTYKYAASSGEDQQCRPNNLLSWTAMRWGCENGYTDFDLGRTDLANAGLRRFKKGWGALESPLTYSTLSASPPRPDKDNGLLTSLRGTIIQKVGTVIQKGPPWVCRLAGELLYRHVG